MEQTLNELKYAIEHCQLAKKENNKTLATKWADIAHSYLDTALNKVVDIAVSTPNTKEVTDESVKRTRSFDFGIKFRQQHNLGATTLKSFAPDMLKKYHNDYQYFIRWKKCPWEK